MIIQIGTDVESKQIKVKCDESRQRRLCAEVAEYNQSAADFFCCLCRTGLRVSELRSLCVTSVYAGELPQIVHPELREGGVPYFGVVVLRYAARVREIEGNNDADVKFVSLKKGQGISFLNTRTIPIFDEQAWSIFSRRQKIQLALLAEEKFGEKVSDYLLFGDVDLQEARQLVSRACRSLSMENMSLSACRAEYSQYAERVTGSRSLVARILGWSESLS